MVWELSEMAGRFHITIIIKKDWTVLFDPEIALYLVILLQVRVDLEVMLMKENSPFPKASRPELQYQLQFIFTPSIHISASRRSHRIQLIKDLIAKIIYSNENNKNRRIGLMGRVFANGPGDLDSIPGRVIPKTWKMVLDISLLNTQHYKVRIKGKVEQSRERNSAFPYNNSL